MSTVEKGSEIWKEAADPGNAFVVRPLLVDGELAAVCGTNGETLINETGDIVVGGFFNSLRQILDAPTISTV